MSYTADARIEHLFNDTFWSDFRMVMEMERKTIRQGKRKVVSRLFHATNDKEAIAAWRSDLNRILLVFNVRSIVFVWPLLTINSQTELAINTHVAIANTHALVSDVHCGVSNTHAIVSDIHRNVIKIQEGSDGQHQAVRDTRCSSASLNKCLPPPRLKIGQRSRLLLGPVTYACV